MALPGQILLNVNLTRFQGLPVVKKPNIFMESGLQYLAIEKDDTKRLQAYFDDKRIVMGRNNRTRQLEVWYKPTSSRPYRICVPVNCAHAIKLLQARAAADQYRAKDMLAKMDAHNEKIKANMRADAMYEVRQDLRRIASGRQFFTV